MLVCDLRRKKAADNMDYVYTVEEMYIFGANCIMRPENKQHGKVTTW